jgi:hypothetical protein
MASSPQESFVAVVSENLYQFEHSNFLFYFQLCSVWISRLFFPSSRLPFLRWPPRHIGGSLSPALARIGKVFTSCMSIFSDVLQVSLPLLSFVHLSLPVSNHWVSKMLRGLCPCIDGELYHQISFTHNLSKRSSRSLNPTKKNSLKVTHVLK